MFESSSARSAPFPRIVAALALFLTVALAAFVPQTAHAQDPTGANATIRFVHASPDTPAVDVIVDGAAIASNLAFGDITGALSVPSGTHQLQFVPAGQSATSPLVDTTFDPDGGTTYVVALSGRLEKLEAKIYDVHRDDLDAGKSRLRLINLAPDDTNVDMYVTGGDKLFDDLAFGKASDYTDLDAGSYDFEVRPHDQETVALSMAGFQIDEGNAYDVLLIGSVTDSSLKVIPITTPVATPCSAVLGIGTPTDACVRFIHASPDAPAVDIYVNGSKVVENLAFGAGTDFVALPAGDDREIQIVSAGNPIEDAILDKKSDFDAGHAYEVVAADMVKDLEAIVHDVDLRTVPEGQSRLRVIHAAPDVNGVDVVITNGPELFDGVDFKDVTDYVTIDAGIYDLQIKHGDDVLIRATDFPVEPGLTYDVLVIGRSDDGSLQLVTFTAPTESLTGVVATPALASTPAVVDEVTPEVVATPAG